LKNENFKAVRDMRLLLMDRQQCGGKVRSAVAKFAEATRQKHGGDGICSAVFAAAAQRQQAAGQ
jgi:hypothetical protein